MFETVPKMIERLESILAVLKSLPQEIEIIDLHPTTTRFQNKPRIFVNEDAMHTVEHALGVPVHVEITGDTEIMAWAEIQGVVLYAYSREDDEDDDTAV